MTRLETGRRKRASAFTLLEVLIALSVLVTGLTLIAAGLGRQVAAVRILETSRSSHHLAERLLLREILFRDQQVESPAPELSGFQSSVHAEVVRLPRASLPDLEMERLIAEVSWEIRGQPRSIRMETAVAKRHREP